MRMADAYGRAAGADIGSVRVQLVRVHAIGVDSEFVRVRL